MASLRLTSALGSQTKNMTLRSCSLAVLVLSLLGPIAYVSYFSWRFNQWAETQHGGVCGMPLLGSWGLGLLAMGALSLVAAGLGIAAFVRLPAPRPRRRLVELLLLALPFLLASSVIVAAVLWD
jgi:hypothetical protein